MDKNIGRAKLVFFLQFFYFGGIHFFVSLVKSEEFRLKTFLANLNTVMQTSQEYK